MERRSFTAAIGAGALLSMLGADGGPSPSLAGSTSQGKRRGRLVIIGGAEDRRHDKLLLRRFVAMSAPADATIAILTAASAYPEAIWRTYESAFRHLGVARLSHLQLESRTEADDDARVRQVLEADGVFLTGGNQGRLMMTLNGSRVEEAMLHTYARGACIGGTSAGAAAMSRTMIAGGREVAHIGLGLGLVRGAVIDQHFTQRQRLGRLLALLAEEPSLMGVGIDENTALIVEAGRGIEVAGAGAVTIVDNRPPASGADMDTASMPAGAAQPVMHRLQAGSRLRLGAVMHPVLSAPAQDADRQARSLRDAVTLLAGG